MTLFTDDIDALFDDLSGFDDNIVTVVLGADTVKGRIETIHEDVEDGGLARPVKVQTVVVRKGVLSTLATDAAITVGGTSYTVRDYGPNDGDNLMTRIHLADAS